MFGNRRLSEMTSLSLLIAALHVAAAALLPSATSAPDLRARHGTAKAPAQPQPLMQRRQCLAALAANALVFRASADTGLGYVDNAGMKSYSSVQRAWEASADMSQREIMMAARGAGKRDSSSPPESDRSRKRRAMAGCHDDVYRKQAGFESEASCNSRVLGGDVQFMLDIIDAD